MSICAYKIQTSVTIKEFPFIFLIKTSTLAVTMNLMEMLQKMEEGFISVIIQMSQFTKVLQSSSHIIEPIEIEELQYLLNYRIAQNFGGANFWRMKLENTVDW